MKKKSKNMSEKETMKVIIDLARREGVEDKVKGIIVKYQDAVKSARTEHQRKHIAAMGLAEIHKTIGCVGALIVDGVEILPEEGGHLDAINEHKGLVRLD